MLAATLVSLALGAGAAELRLSPPERTLTLGTTFSMSVSIEGSTRPFGGYVFDFRYDPTLLTLESLAPDPESEFSDEFFKNPGVDLGGGLMAGLNSKSLTGPVGPARLARARFKVAASTGIFQLGQLRASTVTVSAREVVDTVEVSGATITVNAGLLEFQIVGDTVAPVTQILFQPASAKSDEEGRPVLSTAAALAFSARDFGAYVSGVAETMYLVDQDSSTVAFQTFASTFSLAVGTHTIVWFSRDAAGNAEVALSTQVLVKLGDSAAPSLALQPVSGSTVTTAFPDIAAAYSDEGSGISTASVRLIVDGVDVTTLSVVLASSAVFSPVHELAQGAHTAVARVTDREGNLAQAATVFTVDSLPPVSALAVNGLAASATQLVVISTDAIGFIAEDSGVGVARTLYAVDGSTAELVFSSTFTLSPGTHTVSFRSVDSLGNEEPVRLTSLTVLADDQEPPSLTLAPADGSTVTVASPAIVASYFDARTGVDAATLRLALDGVDVSTMAVVGASSAAFAPAAALSEGAHTATATVSDAAGNAASAIARFFVDTLAPQTALTVNGTALSGASGVAVSTDALGFLAADAGTGVLETRYAVDGGSETVFVSTFSLSPGARTIRFFSVDRAGNREAERTAALDVRAPQNDFDPPALRLDFPGSAALGVERTVSGVVRVTGAASDASAFTWTLASAPGVDASTGFTNIASGAGNISGLLASWNTASLSGARTLRLSAEDAEGNSSAVTAGVFVGRPAFTRSIGRKDADVIVNSLRDPTGIAVRSDGAIWVASTKEDELVLLSSAGAVLATVRGHGSQRLSNPQGLAVDAADHLYVADKGRHRVLKLSPNGGTVLLELAKKDRRGKPKAGSGAGELRAPWDVAVDSNGDIYVADAGNGKVAVFDSAGDFLREFGQGVFPSTSEIRGLALTAEGLWVSDKELERVYLLSREGAVLKTVGDADAPAGEISRARGLASDRLGALYLIEPNRDRVQKLDPQGRGLLYFGTRALAAPSERAAKRWLVQPNDAAVAPDGSLWVTDTGRERIVRYALPAPSGGGFGVAAMGAGGVPVSVSRADPARRLVDARDGARVERDDGAGVDVPRGALGEDLEITVESADESVDREQKAAKRTQRRSAAVSEEVQYGPEGTAFSAPVTLVLPYDAAVIASQGVSESELKVHYWNPLLKDWEALPSTVDREAKTVSAQTSHFSVYQVQGPGGYGVSAADPSLGFKALYAFPNPVRGVKLVTLRVQPGLADSVTVRIYDVSGRKVHESSNFTDRGAFDDGNGLGQQYTYDHVWDVSGIGSGVYTYVVTARKTGQGEVRKTGRLGVVK